MVLLAIPSEVSALAGQRFCARIFDSTAPAGCSISVAALVLSRLRWRICSKKSSRWIPMTGCVRRASASRANAASTISSGASAARRTCRPHSDSFASSRWVIRFTGWTARATLDALYDLVTDGGGIAVVGEGAPIPPPPPTPWRCRYQRGDRCWRRYLPGASIWFADILRVTAARTASRGIHRAFAFQGCHQLRSNPSTSNGLSTR